MSMPLSHALVLGIVALSLALMLFRPRNWPEVTWVGPGALLLVLLRLLPVRAAVRALADGTDVYLFLIGMMLLSELARENGVFDWVSSVAVEHARGSSTRMFLLIYTVGTVVTVTLSNDATAVVLTPAVLAAVRRARVSPLPFLFACALIANAASFVLPISNPANLVVFHGAMPPLGRWLNAFLLPSALSIAVTYAVLRLYFRRELATPVADHTDGVVLTADGKLVIAGLALVVAVLLAASALHHDLGLPTCVAAVAVTAAVCLKRRASPMPLVRAISWTTLLLVGALFMLVRAMESIGALRVSQQALAWAAHQGQVLGTLVTAATVAVANNLVNNLPLGLLAGSTLRQAGTHGPLAHAVLIGVDLGPNLSVTGSLATILWLIALRREQVEVSAWDFLKLGAIAMPLALLASMVGTLLLTLAGVP